MASSPSSAAAAEEQAETYVRVRIANACTNCKARKVKCDGKQPCSYCSRHQRGHLCQFPPRSRRRNPTTTSPAVATVTSAATPTSSRASVPPPPSVPRAESPHTVHVAASPTTRGGSAPAHHPSDASVEDEAEVPRDARLLCDAQGKLSKPQSPLFVFVGDSAPLSFYQTVRQLVTSRIDPRAFAPQTSRVSVLQNVHSSHSVLSGHHDPPLVNVDAVPETVLAYLSATSGLIDFFDAKLLVGDITAWAAHYQTSGDPHAAVNYLVLAIGLQSSDEPLASSYFEYAKAMAFGSLGTDLSVATVQAFTLIAIYMLRACQITGAFLFFGIAARAMYSIGVHRTEINTRFGPVVKTQRDRLWKSLRVVDLYLSISMGRPPATSDVDCTVSYHDIDSNGRESFDLLNASVQILLIIEGIIMEVYSRKKISLSLTEGISRQLREWSSKWLIDLKGIVDGHSDQHDKAKITGACQVLCSYYYAVMLVSRPFLMYEMCKRLPESPDRFDVNGDGSSSGRSKLANASIDAGSLMIESISELIHSGVLDRRMPTTVSWLFAASLVVGVGLLGGFGRILEKYVQMSISALEYFAKDDAHAMQYSLIVKSLYSSATEYLNKKERHERLRITESSSQLFGLMPRQQRRQGSNSNNALTPLSHPGSILSPGNNRADNAGPTEATTGFSSTISSPFGDLDPSLFTFTENSARTPDFSIFGGHANTRDQNDQVFGAFNLFPLLEEGGHIDLAHFL